MSTKILISTLCIAMIPLCTIAQKSKFTLAVQLTTIEAPLPFGGFSNYLNMAPSGGGSMFRKDYSLEILGKLFLNENMAIRLRMGATKYDLDNQFSNINFGGHNKLTGKFEKYAIGIESRRIFGEHLAFRFGGDVQVGFFKDLIEDFQGDFGRNITTFATNTNLNISSFFGGDWFIWQGLAISAELRMPFERVRYQNKGTRQFNSNQPAEFDDGSFSSVGFGAPVSSIQLSYRF
jgi:hypothetical protein